MYDDNSSLITNNIRTKTRIVLNSSKFHTLVIFLTITDVILLITSIIIEEVTGNDKSRYDHELKSISYVSLSIIVFFMFEILITLLTFGLTHYYHDEGWRIRLFDAIIVIITFSLEMASHGVTEQIASLLIILRLWRIVKLVTTTTIVIDEQLTERFEVLEHENQELKSENKRLQEIVNKLQTH